MLPATGSSARSDRSTRWSSQHSHGAHQYSGSMSPAQSDGNPQQCQLKEMETFCIVEPMILILLHGPWAVSASSSLHQIIIKISSNSSELIIGLVFSLNCPWNENKLKWGDWLHPFSQQNQNPPIRSSQSARKHKYFLPTLGLKLQSNNMRKKNSKKLQYKVLFYAEVDVGPRSLLQL